MGGESVTTLPPWPLSVSVYSLFVYVPGLSCCNITDPTVEDLENSRLDGKCASQVSYVYIRSVCFQVQSISVAGLSGGGVLVFNQDRRRGFSRQDGNSVGQDGKYNQQAVEIQHRTVSRWAEPQSRCRVVEVQ